MLHQNHDALHSSQAVLKSGPFKEAKPVLFPAFKYELEGFVIERSLPEADVKLSFKGEVTLQKEGVITGGLTFTKEGVEAEYKQQANGVFKDLFSKSQVNYSNGKAAVSLAVGSTLRSGNQILATTEMSVEPPNGLKYTYKGQEVKGVYEGNEFAGVIGYVLEIHYRTQIPREGHRVQITYWTKAASVAFIVAAGVIVVADVVKDIGTMGGGIVESPMSFAAAAASLSKDLSMLNPALP